MAWRLVDLLSVSDCLLPLLHFVAADVVTFRHTQLLHIYFICLGVVQFNMLYNTHISPMGLDTKLANYILTGKPVDFTLDTLLQFFFCCYSFNWKKKNHYSKRKKVLVSCSCCCSRRRSYRERRSTKEIQHLLSESASSILRRRILEVRHTSKNISSPRRLRHCQKER